MVQLGDFSIQLVEPHSKKPFDEHFHDGKTYIEINDGAEYFISVSKPRAKLFSGTVVLRFYVDGNYLGFNLTYTAACKSLCPKYKGNWKREEGISTDTAIKFVAPRSCSQKGDESGKLKKPSRFGKIKVKIFPTFVQASDGSKRSSDPTAAPNAKLGYDKDCLLSTLTLYCGTPQDLIEAGVIREPTRPRQKSSSRQSNRPSVGMGGRSTKEGNDDCTEEDDSDWDSPSQTLRKMKMNRTEDDSESDSVVFVDPDMDVIVMDDLSGDDDDFHDAFHE